VAGKDHSGATGSGSGEVDSGGKAEKLPPGSGVTRTPLFLAQHSERYARQQLIGAYEVATGANLIVMLDQIFPPNMTYLEELIYDCDSSKPLHLLLSSPGGDGETAIRMVRSMQSRCSELTVLVPDMAKSAATLLCIGADKILMGPAGDLGPVDPQFQVGGRSLASAKEIVAAIDEAERRVKESPDTYPLFAGLLSDVNMLMVEQARNALDRTEALVREALSCCETRSEKVVDALTKALKAPLIDEPASHSAVIDAQAAKKFGLPAESFDPASEDWRRVWEMWTRYFTLGCWPAGITAVYEGRRASHIISPGG
jgi:hypothetical protein